MRISYALSLWLIALLLALSLYSYDPMDVAYNTTHPNYPQNNNVGIVGSWVAFGSLFAFGFASYAIVFILFFLGCGFLQNAPGVHSRMGWVRITAAVLMLVSLACLFQLPMGAWCGVAARRLNLVGAGGVVGDVLSVNLLIPFLGVAGSIAVCTAVCLASALVYTRFNAFRVIGRLFTRISNAVHRSARVSTEVINHKRRVVPLNVRKVRVRPSAGLSRRTRKVKITVPPAAEAQRVVETPRFEKRAPVQPVKEAMPKRVPTRTRSSRSSGAYKLPGIDLLHEPFAPKGKQMEEDLQKNVEVLQLTLKEFGIEAEVGNVIRGPVITRYEVYPAPGVKVQRITALADDLALAMAASSIRIVAPIPGKSAVGIEIPNPKATLVGLKEMLLSKEYRQRSRSIPMAIGKEISGHPVIADLREMPHLLIAGATGSGKTVCVNSLVLTMLFSCTPDELKLILIDPKRVEMTQYRDIPHLLTPVITESKVAAQALRWATREMEKRYNLFSQEVVRDLVGYNATIKRGGASAGVGEDGEPKKPLPFIVIIIDELADLMLVARKEIEDPIIRLAQMGRASGLHIILATQRPSVNVITGLIKANFPTRIAFKVASRVDSKVILDSMGADKLLGCGDMIFMPPGSSRRLRVQGALVDDAEINAAVEFVKSNASPDYREDILSADADAALNYEDIDDSLYDEAVNVVRQLGQASASLLQRRMRIGYTRAARLVDMMEERGIVGPQQGSKAREVIG
ncbi:MAG: DNA translocase FtsK 4TM domain-containing protein [bacterium]